MRPVPSTWSGSLSRATQRIRFAKDWRGPAGCRERNGGRDRREGRRPDRVVWPGRGRVLIAFCGSRIKRILEDKPEQRNECERDLSIWIRRSGRSCRQRSSLFPRNREGWDGGREQSFCTQCRCVADGFFIPAKASGANTCVGCRKRSAALANISRRRLSDYGAEYVSEGEIARGSPHSSWAGFAGRKQAAAIDDFRIALTWPTVIAPNLAESAPRIAMHRVRCDRREREIWNARADQCLVRPRDGSREIYIIAV